jgi:hypothetical protein
MLKTLPRLDAPPPFGSGARRRDQLINKSADCFGSRVVVSLLSSCRWFAAPRQAQTRTWTRERAAPPADNSTGFCACTLYLVFKEPTPTEPESRSR